MPLNLQSGRQPAWRWTCSNVSRPDCRDAYAFPDEGLQQYCEAV